MTHPTLVHARAQLDAFADGDGWMGVFSCLRQTGGAYDPPYISPCVSAAGRFCRWRWMDGRVLLPAADRWCV